MKLLRKSAELCCSVCTAAQSFWCWVLLLLSALLNAAEYTLHWKVKAPCADSSLPPEQAAQQLDKPDFYSWTSLISSSAGAETLISKGRVEWMTGGDEKTNRAHVLHNSSWCPTWQELDKTDFMLMHRLKSLNSVIWTHSQTRPESQLLPHFP